MSGPRIYHRVFDPGGADSLAMIARRVSQGARVLDLGAGPGVLGGYLHDALGCTVDGVEVSPDAAAAARNRYRRLEVADLDSVPLESLGFEGGYDFIVCADVLEHLRDPEQLLAQLPSLLAPGGRLIASVPNVAYAGLVADLLAGHFDYRDEGLLDRTHLRFFTRASLLAMLRRVGWSPTSLDRVVLQVTASEFAARDLSAMAPALRHALLQRPDALTYQFVVEAGREPCTSVPEDEGGPIDAPEWWFRCQLFWRTEATGFNESESAVTLLRMGERRQSVRFILPADRRPLAFRLDPGDRPGFVHLFRLAVFGVEEGPPLWEWTPEATLPASNWQQLRPVPPLAEEAECLVLHAFGDDPALSFDLPESVACALADGGTVEVELSWPMSSDARALARDFVPREDYETVIRTLEAAQAELEGLRRRLTNPPAPVRGSRLLAAWRAWRER